MARAYGTIPWRRYKAFEEIWQGAGAPLLPPEPSHGHFLHHKLFATTGTHEPDGTE